MSKKATKQSRETKRRKDRQRLRDEAREANAAKSRQFTRRVNLTYPEIARELHLAGLAATMGLVAKRVLP